MKSLAYYKCIGQQKEIRSYIMEKPPQQSRVINTDTIRSTTETQIYHATFSQSVRTLRTLNVSLLNVVLPFSNIPINRLIQPFLLILFQKIFSKMVLYSFIRSCVYVILLSPFIYLFILNEYRRGQTSAKSDQVYFELF